MNKAFNTIAIVARLHTPGIAKPLLDLADLLRDRGKRVLLDVEVASEHGIAGYTAVRRDEMGPQTDLMIVIGGDGTMLSVARLLAPYRVPIIGVNQGRLGFITDIALPDMASAVLRILAGECVHEERMLLQASVQRGEQLLHHSLAVNDVVLSRGAMGSMVEFEVFIDQLFVYSQRSDGLIISTPTGSTAYALAAGGPILHPTVPAMTIVPVCPQFLNNRPIVINDTCLVELLLTRGQDSRVFFDNQSYVDLNEMDKVTVSRYPHTLSILHPVGYGYYDVLRTKLHWGQKLI